jgi:signal transduction histidine kinase
MASEAGGQASAQSPRNPMPNRHHAMGGTPPAQGNNSGHNHRASAKSSWITQNLSASDYRGGILLRVDRSGVIAAMSNILWGLTPVSVIGVLAILALTYLLLHYQVIAPIGGIRRVMKRQQSGDRQARAEKQSSLELDEVATAFNRMIDTILESEEELTSHRDYLQKRVNLATIHLKNKALELELALAKEKELNKLQREFVSMASHEFRTPLAIIDTAAQRLKRRADSATPEEAVKRADKIRGAVKRMTRLMDSTLTAARMEEGKIRVEIKPCDIGKVVAEICAVQQEIAQTHVISCDLADLPETIQADIGSLEQVLTNLLSNAVKYAPDAPDIEVKAGTKGDQVVISVRDHGIGIDEDELGRIGERFFRARTSTGIAGTGIGLNLVKTLVEMLGGSISIDSKRGEGSTFSFRVPIAGPDLSQQADAKVA